jgi:single-stranded-DNA-specific exonuclease
MKYAQLLSEQINVLNTERRILDHQITIEALQMIKDDEKLLKCKSTVVFNENWHKGVIGIVASRLTETYYRPTIVLTKSDGLITGSARSVKNFDVYNAIESCRDLLEHFGGHKYAAGLSLKPENLDAFTKKFNQIVDSTIEEKMLIPEIEIDSKISLNEINNKFFRILRQFSPFGPGNMAPIFLTENVVDTGEARIVGKNHLKLSVVHPDITSLPISAIAFQQGHQITNVKKNIPLNICYHIEENEWNNNISLQLNIKDIKQ